MTAVLGPSFGDAALHAAMGHFVVMQRDAAVALSGPPVIRARDRRGRLRDELGGPGGGARDQRQRAHGRRGRDAGAGRRAPVPLLRARLRRAARAGRTARGAGARRRASCATLVPLEPRRGYDMRKVLDCDRRRRLAAALGRALRPQPDLRARAGSRARPWACVASQPMQRAGVLDVPALTQGGARSSTCATRSTCRWCSCRTCPG